MKGYVRSGVVVVLASVFLAFGAGLSIGAGSPEDKLLADNQDQLLQNILENLETEHGVVPLDGKYSVVAPSSEYTNGVCCQEPAYLVPLADLDNRARWLRLIYLPERGLYFFFQVVKDNRGQPKLEIWSQGDGEIVFTPNGSFFQPFNSADTFRLNGDALERWTLKIGQV